MCKLSVIFLHYAPFHDIGAHDIGESFMDSRWSTEVCAHVQLVLTDRETSSG
jgi:hypothetical protein